MEEERRLLAQQLERAALHFAQLARRVEKLGLPVSYNVRPIFQNQREQKEPIPPQLRLPTANGGWLALFLHEKKAISPLVGKEAIDLTETEWFDLHTLMAHPWVTPRQLLQARRNMQVPFIDVGKTIESLRQKLGDVPIMKDGVPQHQLIHTVGEGYSIRLSP